MRDMIGSPSKLSFYALTILVIAVFGVSHRVQAAEYIFRNAAGSNNVIRLTVSGYTIVPHLLDEPAPQGFAFMWLRGTITNRDNNSPIAVDTVERALILQLGDRSVYSLHSLSADMPDSFWGTIKLYPGETRAIEPVFLVPATSIGAAELRYVDEIGNFSLSITDGSVVALSKSRIAQVANESVRLSVAEIRSDTTLAGEQAPDGWRFLTADIWYENLRNPRRPVAIASLLKLIERGQYHYKPDHLTALLAPSFAFAQLIPAGISTRGKVVFLVPQSAGALSLHYESPEGTLSLALTPDSGASPPPATPVIGETGYPLTLSLFGIVRLDEKTTTSAAALIALDIAVASHDQAMHLSPHEHIRLIGGDWASYAPVELSEQLDRPLREIDLWPGEIARGELVFVVPGGVVAGDKFLLTIDAPGANTILPLAAPSERR
jgi:hypothetical protein